jgi:hypothetical protein
MATTGGDLGSRMLGAAFLNVETYEEVEHDQTATGQAAAVVVIVALCQAIGGSSAGLFSAAGAAVLAFVAWLIWAGLTFVIGDKLFGGEATWGELLRTLGFAQAPGVLYLLDILPFVGWVASVVASVWIVIAGFVAVRQALDIGNFKTLLTILIGGAVYSFLALFPFVRL